MKLSEKDLQLQEAILTRIHGCGIEEAREREYFIEGCLYIHIDGIGKVLHSTIGGCYGYEISRDCEDEIRNARYRTDTINKEIIGLPPTLDRVMQAISSLELDSLINTHINNYGECTFRNLDKILFDWELLNEDGTPKDLRQQSEETKDVLHSILCDGS